MLRAVVDEVAAFIGGKVQRVVQPDASTVCLELYGGPERGVGNLLICCHAEQYRITCDPSARNLKPRPFAWRCVRA